MNLELKMSQKLPTVLISRHSSLFVRCWAKQKVHFRCMKGKSISKLFYLYRSSCLSPLATITTLLPVIKKVVLMT